MGRAAPSTLVTRQHGWALVVVLVALALVAWLARDSLLRYVNGLASASPSTASRLPPAAQVPLEATTATPTLATPVERARAVEGVVGQQAESLGRRIEREAR